MIDSLRRPGALAVLIVATMLGWGCEAPASGQSRAATAGAAAETVGDVAAENPPPSSDCESSYPDVDACRSAIWSRLGAEGADVVLVDIAALRARHPADWQAAYLEAWTRFQSLGARRAAGTRQPFEKAADLARAAGDDAGVAACLLMLGAVAEMAEGDLDRAAADYESAARLADRSGDVRAFFQAAWAASTVRRQLGLYAEELAWLERALATLPEDDEGGYRRAGQYASANAHRKMGDVRRSRELLESTLAMARRAGDDYYTASSLMLLAVLEQDYGDPGEAIALLENARDVASAGDLAAMANHADVLVGVTLAIHGDAEEARARLSATLDDALAYSEQDTESTIQGVVNLLFLGEAARRLGRDAEARSFYERARVRAADWLKPNFAWQASGGLARLHMDRGRPDDAVREATRAVAEIEALRSRLPDESQRVYFLRQRSNAFAVLASALEASGAGVDRAFEVVERAHGRTLREALREDAPDEPEPSLRQVRAALLPGELLLSYLLGEDESLLLAVTADAAELHRLPARRDVEAAVAEWTSILRRPLTSVDARVDPLADFVRFADRGRRLRAMLLGPVESRVASAERVIVVPDKQLHRLPFGTLPGEAVEGGAPRLLAGDVALSYVPAAAFVVERALPPSGPVAVVANGAARPDLRLPGLAHADEEAAAVRSAWPEGDVVVAVGERATPAELRRLLGERPDVLHVVGHAMLHPVAGPRIVLAGPDGSPELLDADGIAGLAPTPPLVVLSACETAEGELVGGEGILGLVRAFTLAGSSQIVATRWSTDDAVAARLMGLFHARLRAGATATEALAAARRELLAAGFIHPFSWSGFAVYGVDLPATRSPSQSARDRRTP